MSVRRPVIGRLTRLSLLLLVGTAAIPAATATAAAATPGPAAAVAPAPAPLRPVLPALSVLFDPGALHLSTTTDHLPGDDAANFSTLTGTVVRRVYIVRNDGLLPLTHITLHDPDVPASSMDCDDDHGAAHPGDLGDLSPLSWESCTATFTAQPGVHRETVSATATVPLFHRSVSDSASAGYTAVQPGLRTSVTLKAAGASAGGLPANKPAMATITVTNSGTVPLDHVTATASPTLSTPECADSSSPTIADLEPDRSVTCDAPFTPAPGKQSANVTVTGTWFWTRPITAHGPQPPRHVTVQAGASASYTGVLPPPPSPSPAQPPTHEPAAVIQPPPPPPVPPSPTPQRSSSTAVRPTPPRPTPPTPAPNPTHAVLAAAQQYQPSRGLPLPLKVVAIVIVPAVAVGARRAVANR